MARNSEVTQQTITPPVRGWDLPADLADAKTLCRNNVGGYINDTKGRLLVRRTVVDFYDWGLSPATAYNLLVSVGESTIAKTKLRSFVDTVYTLKSESGALPGRLSREPLPPSGLSSEDDDEEDHSDAGALTLRNDFEINRKTKTAPDTFENAVHAVTKADLQPAWNELKQNYEFRGATLPWDESYGRVLDDHVLRLVKAFMREQYVEVGYKPEFYQLGEAIKTLAYQSKFNPVLEYLDGLTWDGTPRVAGLFPEYMECEDSDYARAVGRCFLVAAVRRQRSPGCKFDTMPVIEGPQGWNKSTALRTLFGDDWFSDADLGNLRDKDASMKLRGIWLQEFAELGSLTRADADTFKAFLSRQYDRQRDPYDRAVRDVPRRNVAAATVNESGYLRDATGGRRYWPLHVLKPIDVAALVRDRDQLWAEASALESEGASVVLPENLWPVAAELQKGQTADNPWKDTIADFLEQRERAYESFMGNFEPKPDDFDDDDDDEPPPPDKVHTDELMEALDIPKMQRTMGQAARLRTTMHALGWAHAPQLKISGRNKTGYVKQVGR